MSRVLFVASILAIGLAAPAAQACDACIALGHDLHLLPGVGLDATVSLAPVAASAPLSLTVPIYHSLPGASARLYLDFDGDMTAGWGSYSPGTTPAYSTDADTSSFSSDELKNIHEIWSRVSEFYSPFNIDVTTEDPGPLNDLQSLRVVIGGDGKRPDGTYWPGAKAGGIGYIGGFYNFNPNTVYVFPGNLANGTPKYTAEAAAHESGHGFGLQHQSTYNSAGSKLLEYNPGSPDKAPFMGRPYEATRGLWWYGASLSSTYYQDDLSILAGSLNGLYYRPDDHGDTPASATLLDVSNITFAASGVITMTSDIDMFQFEVFDVRWLSATVTGAPFGGMLDASLSLFSADGQLLLTQATASLSESIGIELAAGQYCLAVSSAGNYGDVGQFFLTGTLTIPEPACGLATVSLALLLRRGSAKRHR